MKKGGAGKGNWGDSVKDSVVEGENIEKPVEEKTEEATAEVAEPAAPAEPEDTTLTLDAYMKQREEAQKALLAKLGVAQPAAGTSFSRTTFIVLFLTHVL